MRARDVVFILVGFLICYLLTLPLHKEHRPSESIIERDTIFDTIAVVQPIPRDTTIIRYVRVAIPTPIDIPPSAEPTVVGGLAVDSIALPITSKHYSDSLYDAWVSGFEPSLDSIKIYPRTITERITAPAPPRRRWHIGPSIGISATPHGLQPTVGLTLTYSLMSF